MSVIILEDVRAEISLEDETITLIGVNDPSFQTGYLFGDAESVMSAKLTELHTDGDGYTTLLSHRPELFDTYVASDMDLVLSGHAHGGQFRLPFVGGLVAPNQGLFPEYDAGLYTEENTNMLGCSVGKGNLLFHMRGKQAFSFYNRKTGNSVRLVLKPKPEGMTKAESFAYYQGLLPAEMFEVKEATIALPEKARLFDSYICECCGEVTGANWIRLTGDKKLCLDCYQTYDRFSV